MNRIIYSLSLLVIMGALSACQALDNSAKPNNDLAKDATKVMQDLGQGAENAGHAVSSSVKDMQKGSQQISSENKQSNDSSQSNDGKQSKDLQKNATDAINFIGDKASMAGNTIVNTVESVGKNSHSSGKNGSSNSGPSLSDELNGFGKNVTAAANNAGASIDGSLKSANKSVNSKAK